MVVVPVTHGLIHCAAVHTARLPLSLLDEVAKERGARSKRRMIDVSVEGLVHSEYELSHPRVSVGLLWLVCSHPADILAYLLHKADFRLDLAREWIGKSVSHRTTTGPCGGVHNCLS